MGGARTLDDLGRDEAPVALGETLRLPVVTGSLHPSSLPALPLGAASAAGADEVDLVLGRTLGEGGMGIVCLARQVSLDREVVVKRVRPGAPPRAAEGLVREARVAGGLEHPNIVPIHALGLDAAGVPALVMKRIEGTSWTAALRAAPGDLERHLGILAQVCQAVHYAHSRGVLHRDLKPDNVMIGRFGEVYVVDWGIAARLEPGSATEVVAGTPIYMAPEMTRVGRPISPATDVYLLGACLHEILTGRAPHHGDDLEAVFEAAERSEPAEYPGVPEPLAAIARRATAPDPADRYPTAADLQAAIGFYLRHRSSLALVEAARARVAELRALLAGDGSAARIEELFTEARFGLRQAAESSGDPQLGADDLSGLIADMIRFKLTHGDLGGADALLAQHGDPSLRAELARRRAEQDAALHLAQELDPRRHASGRLIGIAATVLFFATVTVFLLTRVAHDVSDYDHRTAFFVALSTGTAIGVGLVLFRRRLWDTSFNRVISGAAALSVAAIVANRALGWRLGVPVPAMMAADLLFIAVAILGTIGWLAPALRITAVPYALGALAIALVPSATMPIFGGAALIGMTSLLAVSWWTWGRER